ncbi:hypothetical protein JQ559_06935 [Bradyrhizobium viridifuturi]|jgi:hypothetical protein|nr:MULTISPECIES: hypothetical protein [Bradyrhizobium]ERF86268.1 MAG: NitT/TauT family transport system permease [Bradyrhizobium sp. DFCI-1]OYU59954.1 MAG: hypothetical protein CFE30_23070 [Bradyrhizobium sp. PARBB1]PSO29271.1 hypothetical protein C7G43_01545 [Bradyrhizobium sp. MOS004]QRI71039.1 hypothetical protein JQ507_05870 [Bradyrhizobium sp. PSBB068]MBR1020398.1 hypothetical protein [Bradyrhizobium viridifuturi]
MQHAPIVAAHWVYLLGVAVIVLTMIWRANVVVPSVIATLLVALAWTHSPVAALASVFNASFTAAKELFNIFLVIALMTALLNALKALRSDIRMVEPFRAVMKTGHTAYFVLAAITYVISLFFWPTPAVPLVSAVLLPAAIAAGLSPLGGAIAIAIAGQGMALSSDYVIGVAPGISAKAAGAAVSAATVADRALVLSLITGGIALTLAYLSIRKSITKPDDRLLERWQAQSSNGELARLEQEGSFDKAEIARGTAEGQRPFATQAQIDKALAGVPTRREGWSKFFAVATPLAFLCVIAVMVLAKLGIGHDLKGGDAAALVGGVAAMLMICASSISENLRKFLDTSADHVTEGFVFAFKAMGSVLPIAGFFFLGAEPGLSAPILGVPAAQAPSLLFELIQTAQAWIPGNEFFVAFGILISGMITGIDGSGFAGLPLTGSLSGALAPSVGMQPATLAAIGQMGAVWTGGGTLVAWSSLIAVAGFARVPVFQIVRTAMVPVLTGLAVSTVCAVLIWH